MNSVIYAQNVTLDEVVSSIRNDENVADQKVIINDLHFDTNSANVSEESKIILDNVALVLQKMPTIKLRIEGHSDNVGNAENNKKLSKKRSESVTDYLISQGVSSHRINYIGLGEDVPIFDNSSEEGRAKNRRVQIVFEELDIRTHYIVLHDGSQLSAVVILINDSNIEYKTLENESFISVEKSRIKEIRFADGTVLKQLAPKDTDGDGVIDEEDKCPKKAGLIGNDGCPKETEPKENRFSLKLGDKPPKMDKGFRHLQLGVGLSSNLQAKAPNTSLVLPAVYAMYEKGLSKNIGASVAVGLALRKDKTWGYSHRYWSIAFRGIYHLNVHDKIDPYGGMGFTFRRYSVVDRAERCANGLKPERNDTKREANNDTSLNIFLGCRYFLNETKGAFIEMGNDGITTFKLGGFLKF